MWTTMAMPTTTDLLILADEADDDDNTGTTYEDFEDGDNEWSSEEWDEASGEDGLAENCETRTALSTRRTSIKSTTETPQTRQAVTRTPARQARSKQGRRVALAVKLALPALETTNS
jgi:hypothetical protein